MTCPLFLVLILISFGCSGADDSPSKSRFPGQFLATIDKDKNQFIDRNEFEAVASKDARFENFDTNSDGQIDEVELLRSLLAYSPSKGKLHRQQKNAEASSWSDWEMHARRNGLTWDPK